MQYVKGIFKKLPSDSSDSVTHQLLLPNTAELPNKFNTPPLIMVGSKLPAVKILDTNDVVTGSHGKTTTTSLVSSIFTAGNLDPTIINGGVLNLFGNSAVLGKSNWCVTESDESDGSFLKIPFTYSIATNLDSEHLDFYKNLNNLKKSFQKFIEIKEISNINEAINYALKE
jgi:UDP-N-acetylmuramate--alanine ligase